MEEYNSIDEQIEKDVADIKKNSKKEIFKTGLIFTSIFLFSLSYYIINKNEVNNQQYQNEKSFELKENPNITYLTKTNIDSIFKNNKEEYLIINVTAPNYCIPCRKLEPHFNEFANKYNSISFIQKNNLNSKIDKELEHKYQKLIGTNVVPTIFFIKKENKEYKVIKKLKGYKPKEIKREIKKIIN